MMNRIAHKNQEISGVSVTRAYVQHHQKYAAFQYQAFIKELTIHYQQRSRQLSNRFLEVGSGPGFLAQRLATHYPQAEINALELSADMIAAAKIVVSRTHPANRVRFIQGSVDDRSTMAHLGKFDVVYSTFSLHHWEKPVQAIKSMFSALRDNGLMILYDFKRVPWLYWLPSNNGFLASIRAAYRPSEIRRMLSWAGITQSLVKTSFPYFWQTIVVAK